ncbi:DUF7261 family protein [Halobellus litoreus]|uniref:Flagellin n=1 Tax=Halobellus litoreus TaxID=755310 RepID=A0ABD6DSA1_9EURY|nr:hypothetical protein [Halobellus litoreus]
MADVRSHADSDSVGDENAGATAPRFERRSRVRRAVDRDRGQRSRVRPAADRDRGQLLLVGALALAVLFVALALLLNTAIYTGNLATRDAGVDAAPAVEYVSDSRAAGVEAIRSVNYRNNTDHAELNAAFRATVARWDGLASHHRAVAGDLAAVEVANVTNGTRIGQDDASREFTSAGGDANWTVAADAELSGVRSMRFSVEESALAAGPSDAFHVNVTSDGATRSLYVYENGGDAEIRVVDDGTELSSRSFDPGADGTVAIDVSNGSVDGTPYAELETVIDVDDDTEIEYVNGDMAGGTYTMVLDEDAANGAALSTPGSGEPYATPAIYAATFEVTYRTSDLDYEAGIEVRPE